jgi:hypothetical protein
MMLKNIKNSILWLLFILIFSNTYAENLDRHRFGISIEGGYSFSMESSDHKEKQAPEIFKGNFGGTLFYQLTIHKYFAIRPEVGLYSYFFGLPVDYSGADYFSTYGVTYTTLNGRIGVGLVAYYYRSKSSNFVLNVALTPLISMRFYDSANLYKNKRSEDPYEELGLKNERLYYFSGGITIATGIETNEVKKAGFGGSFFIRFSDKSTQEGDKILLVPSFGGIFSVFF